MVLEVAGRVEMALCSCDSSFGTLVGELEMGELGSWLGDENGSHLDWNKNLRLRITRTVWKSIIAVLLYFCVSLREFICRK